MRPSRPGHAGMPQGAALGAAARGGVADVKKIRSYYFSWCCTAAKGKGEASHCRSEQSWGNVGTAREREQLGNETKTTGLCEKLRKAMGQGQPGALGQGWGHGQRSWLGGNPRVEGAAPTRCR